MPDNIELENQNNDLNAGLGAENENNQDITDEGNQGNNSGGGENLNNADINQDISEDKAIYGAPENYDYKDIKLPEGYEYDKDMLKEFDALNKETNLSQAQANKYMEFGLKLAQKQAGNIPAILKQVQQAKVTQYKQALNTDKEMGGGDKNKMNAYLDVAEKGYSAFASDDVKAALADAGLNYHPAVIKMFHKIGELVGDDHIFSANKPMGTNNSDPAEILYGANG